jgi:hypothetical protein
LSCLSPRNCLFKISFISFCIIPFHFVSHRFRFISFRWISFPFIWFGFAYDWFIDCWLLNATSVIFQLYCAEWRMKTTVTWGDNFLYIHGDVLTIGILFLILCLACNRTGLPMCSSGAAEPRPLYILILMPILNPISDRCLTKSSLSPNFYDEINTIYSYSIMQQIMASIFIWKTVEIKRKDILN